MKPIVIPDRSQGASAQRSVAAVKTKPRTNEPLMFTTKVSQGNALWLRRLMRPPTPYRASAPRAPATPIAIAVRISDRLFESAGLDRSLLPPGSTTNRFGRSHQLPVVG